jgi:hypothetical protein
MIQRIKLIEISNRLLKATKTLCNALENMLKTIKQPTIYQTKFLLTKQLSRDTPIELRNRIRALARKVYPDVDAVLRNELACI